MYESKDIMVSHPPHYQTKMGIECIDCIEAFTEGLEGVEAYDTGQVIKYISRWSKKHHTLEGKIQDIEKVIWYATHLKGILESQLEENHEHH